MNPEALKHTKSFNRKNQSKSSNIVKPEPGCSKGHGLAFNVWVQNVIRSFTVVCEFAVYFQTS